MKVPEPKFKHSTDSAIKYLAKKFSLPYSSSMQDWEYEVADYNRIEEFVDELRKDDLANEVYFSLLNIIIQSFEESEIVLGKNQLWFEVQSLIEKRFKIHEYSVWYWSAFEAKNNSEQWKVSTHMRNLYIRNLDK